MFISSREVMVKSVGENIEKLCKELGIESIEISIEGNYESFLPNGEKVNALKKEKDFISSWKNCPIKIYCILEHNDFSGDEKIGIDYIKNGIRIAEEIGAEVIRIDPLPRKEKKDKEEIIENAVRIISKALSDTKNSSIKLGMENHGEFGNDPNFLKEIIEKVDSPNLGYTLDTGNFYWSGKPLSIVYEIIKEISPYVFHTHVKNIKYPPNLREKQREIGYLYSTYVSPIYEGDIDHSKIVKILNESGYRGDLCVEDESLGKFNEKIRKEILRKDINYLKSLISSK